MSLSDMIRDAFEDTQPVYDDVEIDDVLLRLAKCLVAHLECKEWWYVHRANNQDKLSKAPEIRTDDDQRRAVRLSLEIRGKNPQTGITLEFTLSAGHARPRKKGILVDALGFRMNVTPGKVRWDNLLDLAYAELRNMAFASRDDHAIE